jgi:hypothetical protein
MHSATSNQIDGWGSTDNLTNYSDISFDINYGCNWIDVDSLPDTSNIKTSNHINKGSEVITSNDDDYTYYYIQLTAKYNEDISSYWPKAGCATTKATTTTTERGKTTTSTTNYSLIDWGTEYGSPYQAKYGSTEPNIRPYYGVMDKYIR